MTNKPMEYTGALNLLYKPYGSHNPKIIIIMLGKTLHGHKSSFMNTVGLKGTMWRTAFITPAMQGNTNNVYLAS